MATTTKKDLIDRIADSTQQRRSDVKKTVQAFLDQVPAADIAIQNSGSCLSDVAAGDFTVNDAMALLPRSADREDMKRKGLSQSKPDGPVGGIELSGIKKTWYKLKYFACS